MATITKEIKMICVKQGEAENNNKFWYGRVFDDGSVETEWGRVGGASQKKAFPGQNENFLLKKKAEKEAKGYKELRVVSNYVEPAKVESHNLKQIALAQIKASNPLVTNFIEKLVKANIHAITKATNITYDADTGLFKTPLGIVTPDAIDEARNILIKMQPMVEKKEYKDIIQPLCDYLVLIPQDIGMKKLNPEIFFPDATAITKQNGILDSLAASYQSVITAPKKVVDGTTVSQPVEQVFNVELDLVTDPLIIKCVEDKYKKTRKDNHVCAHLKVKRVYAITIGDMKKNYDLCPIGNEMELWHGTSTANLLSIMKSGLRISPPSTTRLAGKMFGAGQYFAADSTKSLNYAYGYWSGQRNANCHMFIATVKMGKTYHPRHSDGSLPNNPAFKGYDSTWARAKETGLNNDEMIVYKNEQSNLKYLVEFDE